MRKWALSFEDLLQDETGRNEFELFLKKEYSQENIRFYKACKELTSCPQSQVSRWKADIEKYTIYLPLIHVLMDWLNLSKNHIQRVQ